MAARQFSRAIDSAESTATVEVSAAMTGLSQQALTSPAAANWITRGDVILVPSFMDSSLPFDTVDCDRQVRPSMAGFTGNVSITVPVAFYLFFVLPSALALYQIVGGRQALKGKV